MTAIIFGLEILAVWLLAGTILAVFICAVFHHAKVKAMRCEQLPDHCDADRNDGDMARSGDVGV